MRVLAICFLLVFARATAEAQTPRYDLVITGGMVIDGTGVPAYRADVAINAGRIAAVSRTPIDARCAARINATGLIVSPGFIDLHAHLDPILTMPDAESHVRQGVTLALGGPDDGGAAPMGPYLARVEQQKLGLNVAFLTGHNTIRRAVMGTANRAPTPDELQRMRSMVTQSMGQGAFGLSTGLRYIPGFYSNTDEVVELAQVAADSGGIYTSHLREEAVGLFEGVAEALEIGPAGAHPGRVDAPQGGRQTDVGKKRYHAGDGRLGASGGDRRDDRPVPVYRQSYRTRHPGPALGARRWRLGAAATPRGPGAE
jgi:dihydroorotase/N-acyl-D-amino-acid deacylase